ncbi:MAG TPA: nascent polypeptide-associated complex protein [archaeon]|nr:nascent polypeptide-associated complex protein [archaeon]
MKINPKMLEQAMKKMGIKSEEIPAEEVIIKTAEKELVVLNPQVTRVNMGGQESFQITGEITERSASRFSEEDLKIIIEQTGVTKEEASKALEETGDIADAILKLKKAV